MYEFEELFYKLFVEATLTGTGYGLVQDRLPPARLKHGNIVLLFVTTDLVNQPHTGSDQLKYIIVNHIYVRTYMINGCEIIGTLRAFGSNLQSVKHRRQLGRSQLLLSITQRLIRTNMRLNKEPLEAEIHGFL